VSIANEVAILEQIIREEIPGNQEELDLSARIIAYALGRKYSDIICTAIPSKK